jgi:SAM-dependent methyltransferase
MTALRESPAADAFDLLYRGSRDPWRTQTRWYERRKRSLLLASLPCEFYDSIYEAGCGTGHISLELSPRCTELLASDASADAVVIASAALAARTNVTVERHRLPDDWPARGFDLIVLSELIYFVDAAARRRIAVAAQRSAGNNGTVVACDWRDPIEGYGMRGDEAHRHFEAALDLPRLFQYEDDDFLLTGWSADPDSVARREGLR